MGKRLRNNKGFTLVEVILSVAIFGIIVIPLSTAFSQSIRINASARDRLAANQLAQQYLEQEYAQDYIVPGTRTDNAVVAGVNYTVQTQVEAYSASGTDPVYKYPETGNNIPAPDVNLTFTGGTSGSYDYDVSSYLTRGGNAVEQSSNTIGATDTLDIAIDSSGNMDIDGATDISGSSGYIYTENTEISLYITLDIPVQNLKVNLDNHASKQCKVYILRRNSDDTSKVAVKPIYGSVSVVNNIYMDSGTANPQRVFIIKVTVSKGTKQLVQLTRLKNID